MTALFYIIGSLVFLVGLLGESSLAWYYHVMIILVGASIFKLGTMSSNIKQLKDEVKKLKEDKK